MHIQRKTMADRSDKNGDSISGMSAELFISKDDSLASLLLNHGIKVRDFILLSFLSDQGPMSVERLARVVGLGSDDTERGLKRLSNANLVIRDPMPREDRLESITKLTGRGEEIARRVANQIEEE
jgi:DNA-binding MarR family transcriptional regulator